MLNFYTFVNSYTRANNDFQSSDNHREIERTLTCIVHCLDNLYRIENNQWPIGNPKNILKD